jgi:hypothetical protein
MQTANIASVEGNDVINVMVSSTIDGQLPTLKIDCLYLGVISP